MGVPNAYLCTNFDVNSDLSVAGMRLFVACRDQPITFSKLLGLALLISQTQNSRKEVISQIDLLSQFVILNQFVFKYVFEDKMIKY